MDGLSHRRARRVLRIVNADGTPAANTALRLRQTGHEFLFGCGAFDTLPYLEHEKNGTDEERAFRRERMERWLKLYNYGTLPFYWGGFEPEEGKPETESCMEAAKFLVSRGVAVKGHPLCWHTACADWLLRYDDETIFRKQLERIRREISGFRGVIDKWDVINETVIMPVFDRYDNAVTRICRYLGRERLIKEVFTAAREANPDAELLINDFDNSTAYVEVIDRCLQAGVPISAVGIQSHQHQGYWGREKIERILARFEPLGLPIHFTENTITSGPRVPAYIKDLNDYRFEDGDSTPEGEERQADEVEDMLRVLFARPSVTAFTCWDFTDGMWLNAPSGVLRRDNSVKPVYERLMKLINEEWRTDTVSRTNEYGVAEAEGFKGSYVIELDGKTADFMLTDGDDEITVTIK